MFKQLFRILLKTKKKNILKTVKTIFKKQGHQSDLSDQLAKHIELSMFCKYFEFDIQLV